MSLKTTLQCIYEAEPNSKLIACHRGKAGASVLENTATAFDIAVKYGADIVEVDIAKTADGEMILFHDNTLERLTEKTDRVENYTLQQLQDMPVRLYYGGMSRRTHINTVEEGISVLKDRAMVAIDKYPQYWPEIAKIAKKLDMEHQIIYKSPLSFVDEISWVKENGYLFMPMLLKSPVEQVLELAENMPLRMLEFHIKTLDDLYFSDTFIKKMHDLKILLWVNTINLSEIYNSCAQMDDLKSLIEGPQHGWGKLYDAGINILQTDWPNEVNQYLKSVGLRR